MQILKYGKMIYTRRKKYFYEFYTDTVNQYDDLKRIRKNCEENILRGRVYAGYPGSTYNLRYHLPLPRKRGRG
jgi:hypothetical protein